MPPVQVHPRKCGHAHARVRWPLRIVREWRELRRGGGGLRDQLRHRVPPDGGERIARAVGKSELERAGRRREQHVTVLVPAPAWISGKTKRFPARRRALQIRQGKPDLNRLGLCRIPEIGARWIVVRLGVNGLAVLPGTRGDRSPITKEKRK